MGRRGRHEGSIYRRSDGRWAGAVTLDYQGGRRRRKQVYGRTRKEVRDQIAKLLTDQQFGLPISTERQTVGQFLEHWLESSARPRLRPRTFAGYKTIVSQHLIPVLGKTQLRKLTPQHVQQMLIAKTNEGLAPRTVGGIRAVLRTALTQALKWRLVAWNVAVPVDLPRASRPQFRVLEPRQAQELLRVAADHRLGPLFSVALAVGLRLGESLGLAWGDVDLSARTLRVRRALQRFDGKLRFVEPKSESSNRRVALPESAVDVLRRHRVRQKTERLLAGERWRETGLVFTTTIGTPLDDRNVRKAFRELLDAAELPPMRIHDLRHTCASLLLAQGVHPRVVMETLGHSQISLTLDTYSHVMPTLERDAADRMDAVLTGSG